MFQDAACRTPPAPCGVLEHKGGKMCLCPLALCSEGIVGSCVLQRGSCNDSLLCKKGKKKKRISELGRLKPESREPVLTCVCVVW